MADRSHHHQPVYWLGKQVVNKVVSHRWVTESPFLWWCEICGGVALTYLKCFDGRSEECNRVKLIQLFVLSLVGLSPLPSHLSPQLSAAVKIPLFYFFWFWCSSFVSLMNSSYSIRLISINLTPPPPSPSLLLLNLHLMLTWNADQPRAQPSPVNPISFLVRTMESS